MPAAYNAPKERGTRARHRFARVASASASSDDTSLRRAAIPVRGLDALIVGSNADLGEYLI
jgi:hypothetical protein